MNNNEFEYLLEMCSACSEESSADGIEMLMANLAKIHEYSGEMMSLLSRGESDVEDWIEDKISKAAQSISDAKHYIEYKKSAYATQSRAIEMHGSDMTMGQRMSIPGQPRIQGERMPSMTQIPAMTAQSSMQAGGGCGNSEIVDDYQDHSEEGYEDDYSDGLSDDLDDDDSGMMVAFGLGE